MGEGRVNEPEESVVTDMIKELPQAKICEMDRCLLEFNQYLDCPNNGGQWRRVSKFRSSRTLLWKMSGATPGAFVHWGELQLDNKEISLFAFAPFQSHMVFRD